MGRPISSAILLAGLFVFLGASVSNAQFLWTGTISNDPTVGGNWSGGTAPIGTSGTESLTFGNVSPSPQYVQIPAAGFAVLNLNFTGSATTYYFSGTSAPTLALYGDVIAATDSDVVLDSTVKVGLTPGNHTINVDTNGYLEADGAISDISTSSGIIKTGTGTLVLGGSSTFTGGVTVNAGTLLLGSSTYDDGGVHGPVGSGTLTLKDQSTLGVADDGTTTLVNNVALDSSGGNVTIDTYNGDLKLNGTITGAAALTVVGGDTLTLTGNNTFSGGVTVKDWSELDLGSSTKDGSGTVTFFNGSIQSGPVGTGTLTLQDGAYLSTAGTDDIVLANNIVLPGTGDNVTINLNKTHYDSGSDAYLSDGLTLAGTISGSGVIDLYGFGNFTLDGNNSGWSGGLNVYGNNYVSVFNQNALGTGPLWFDSESEATVHFITASPALNGLSGGFTDYNTESSIYYGSTILLDSGTALTVNQPTDATFSGLITGAGSLVKTGPGTLTLDGYVSYTNNSGSNYSGGTTINGGTLVAAANGVLGSGNVAVNSGGTLAVYDATLNNTVNVNNGGTVSGDGLIATGFINTGGTLSPGSVGGCPIGTLSFNDLTLGKGGTYIWNSKDQYSFDQVDVNYSSTLTINATSLPGEQFTLKLISLDASDNTGPSFPSTGYVTGSTYTFNVFITNGISGFSANKFIIDSSQFFTDNYPSAQPLNAFSLSQVGNNIVLSFTPVPEPSTYVLLTLGMASLALTAFRRRLV